MIDAFSPNSSHYENDHRQMLLTFALIAVAAIISSLLILWAVM